MTKLIKIGPSRVGLTKTKAKIVYKSTNHFNDGRELIAYRNLSQDALDSGVPLSKEARDELNLALTEIVKMENAKELSDELNTKKQKEGILAMIIKELSKIDLKDKDDQDT